MAREDQLVTMSFTLKEQCPGNWGIKTISCNTRFAKEVELHIDGIMKNSWVRISTVYIISCVLVIVIVYYESLNCH